MRPQREAERISLHSVTLPPHCSVYTCFWLVLHSSHNIERVLFGEKINSVGHLGGFLGLLGRNNNFEYIGPRVPHPPSREETG